MRPIAVLPLLALAACTPTAAETAASDRRAAVAQTKLATELAGLTPREPSTCLPLTTQTQYQTQGYGPTILYKVSRGLVYRNDTTGGCENIARGDILVTRQPTGRLCAGDIATTLDRVSRVFTGTCSLGQFVPYRRP